MRHCRGLVRVPDCDAFSRSYIKSGSDLTRLTQNANKSARRFYFACSSRQSHRKQREAPTLGKAASAAMYGQCCALDSQRARSWSCAQRTRPENGPCMRRTLLILSVPSQVSATLVHTMPSNSSQQLTEPICSSFTPEEHPVTRKTLPCSFPIRSSSSTMPRAVGRASPGPLGLACAAA